MSAYWINVFTQIRDEDRVRQYAELAGPAIIAVGGRFLARGNPRYVLEGAGPLRTTLIEFADADAAIAAYNSAGYQAALAVLGDGATREIRILDGL
jgi:uncharacterized protein (DUF1330 family)